MQTVFNKMNWCNANLFFLNFDKCFSISFSKHPNHVKFNYILENGTTCIRVNSIKDPGVIFDSKLTFKENITYVVGRANQSFISRSTKSFKNPDVIKYLYLTLTKSILMYASAIWRPNMRGEINRIERVQHKVLRKLALLTDNPTLRFNHDCTLAAESFYLAVNSCMTASVCIFVYKIMSYQVKCTELADIFLV